MLKIILIFGIIFIGIVFSSQSVSADWIDDLTDWMRDLLDSIGWGTSEIEIIGTPYIKGTISHTGNNIKIGNRKYTIGEAVSFQEDKGRYYLTTVDGLECDFLWSNATTDIEITNTLIDFKQGKFTDIKCNQDFSIKGDIMTFESGWIIDIDPSISHSDSTDFTGTFNYTETDTENITLIINSTWTQPPVNDTPFTPDANFGESYEVGYRFIVYENSTLVSVDKFAGLGTPNVAYLHYANGTVMSTASIVGGTATFTENNTLVKGQSYIIGADLNGGDAMTIWYKALAGSYPVVGTNMEVTTGWYEVGNHTNSYVFVSMLTERDGYAPDGTYTSSVIDATTESIWDYLNWSTPFLYNQELPDNSEDELQTEPEGANMTGNVLLLHLNDGNTANLSTSTDTSGNSNDGILITDGSGSGCDVAGKLNDGCDFGGDGDFIETTYNTDNDVAYTFSAWVKPGDDLVTQQSVMGKNNGPQITMGVIDNRFRYYDGGSSVEALTDVIANAWHHVVGTSDGSTARLYINGIEDNTASSTLADNTNSLFIGALSASDPNTWNGTIDEVAVWNRTLSADEIHDIYQRGLELKFQATSCADSGCSDGIFVGPDNTSLTYFLENVSLNTTLTPDNQYFQYKAFFATGETSQTPYLMSIDVGYTMADMNPTFFGSSFLPSPAYSNSTLNASIGCQDAENDTSMEMTLSWWKENEVNTSYSAFFANGSYNQWLLHPDNISRGETWAANITCFDGTNTAETQIGSINISNLVPGYTTAPDINSSSGNNLNTDDLFCKFIPEDVDADTVTGDIEWLKDNISQFIISDQSLTLDIENSFKLESANTTVDDLWNCQVRLFDIAYTPWINTSQLTIISESLTITGETKSPIIVYDYSDVRVNATITSINLDLDTVWLSSDYTGTWVNYTNNSYGFVNDGNVWSYIISSGNLSKDQVVNWIFYANDTLAKVNASGTSQSFTVQITDIGCQKFFVEDKYEDYMLSVDMCTGNTTVAGDIDVSGIYYGDGSGLTGVSTTAITSVELNNSYALNVTWDQYVDWVNGNNTYARINEENIFAENQTFEKDVIIDGILYGGSSPVMIAGVNISNDLFMLEENRNSTSRFTLQNLNESSNASAVISAINDVGHSMFIGIGSSQFMLGDENYNNITALISKSRGQTIFANFFKQAFIWLYNPSDDNDANNLVEIMALNESGLHIVGNITSDNSFIPQYVFVHTNITLPVRGSSLWTNLTFDQEVTPIKQGIEHTSTDITNTTFTINADGIYDISFNIDVIDTSASASDIDIGGRLIYTNGTEIDGSMFETDLTKQQIETELSHEFLAELKGGDKIVFQFIANDADIEMSTHGTFGDHPDSASVVIKKIANLP